MTYWQKSEYVYIFSNITIFVMIVWVVKKKVCQLKVYATKHKSQDFHFEGK